VVRISVAVLLVYTVNQRV